MAIEKIGVSKKKKKSDLSIFQASSSLSSGMEKSNKDEREVNER